MAAPIDESAPLLGSFRASAAPTEAAPTGRPVPSLYRLFRLSQRQKVTLVSFFAIFLVELSVASMMPAINSMMESILCREQYSDIIIVGDGDPRCKASDVQQRLAMLRGWQMTFECIPAVLFSMPYGILADKIGRRPVLALAWLGLVLQLGWHLVVFYFSNVLPLWALWFTAVFVCIGSFQSLGPAMIYTALGDVTPQEERASCYFRLNAALLIAELLSNPLGGALLQVGNWLPLLFGFGGSVLSALVVLVMPETLNFDHAADRVVHPAEREQQQLENVADADGIEEAAEPSPPKQSTWRQFVHMMRTDAAATSRFILHNRAIMMLLVPSTFIILGRFVQELLLQYATKRYSWSWSRAAYLLTVRSAANLLMCLVVLPFVSDVLIVRRFGVAPLRKDLWLARASSAALCVGALLIAFAVTPWLLSVALVVFSLGGGYGSVMRSLLNALVESHHLAMLNALLGLLEFGGLMVAAPVLYDALRQGIELGGPWIGLPFLYAAGMFLVGTAIVCLFRIPPAIVAEEDGRAEDAAT